MSVPGLQDVLQADIENVFLNPKEFAENTGVVYTPKVGDPYTINAIFDDTSEFPMPEGMHSAQQTKWIRVLVQESLITGGVRKGDRVTARAALYDIERFDSDGTGMVVLWLQEVDY